LHLRIPQRNNGYGSDGISAGSRRLSNIHPRCEVAVVATPDGKFTFQIFAVSSEPKTLEIGTERYMTPADAGQAGHAMIATKRLSPNSTTSNTPR
jgi:hypothetical protein